MLAAACLLYQSAVHSQSPITSHTHSWLVFSLWNTVSLIFSCYYIFLQLWPLFCVYKDLSLQYQSFSSFSVPSSLSLFVFLTHSLPLSRARFLLSSLAARLAGCQLLIHTGNILAMMAAYGLCQTEYNKQEIRLQTKLLGRWEEEEKWQ